MAYTSMVAYKTTDNSTITCKIKTSAMVKLTTAGCCILTGGSSRLDPTRMLFVLTRNSSAATDGLLTLQAGSTAGNSDYFPGAYSTLNNLNITVQQTGTMTAGVSGRNSAQFFYIADVAKYLDTDDRLKFLGAADITSKTAATAGTRIGVIYLKHGGH